MAPLAAKAGGDTHAAAVVARRVTMGTHCPPSSMPTPLSNCATTLARCCSLTALSGSLHDAEPSSAVASLLVSNRVIMHRVSLASHALLAAASHEMSGRTCEAINQRRSK